MNKIERFRAALAGEPVDCIPCGFWSHFPEAMQFGEKSVTMHNQFYIDTDIDIMKVMNEHLYRLDCEVNCPEDWKKIHPFQISGSYYENYLEEIRQVRAHVGDQVPILATIHGLLVSACHATDGVNQFTRLDNKITLHLKEEPEAVSQGLKAIAETLAELCEHCVKAGADGIYYAALGGEEQRFEQALFERYVKPLEIDILKRAKNKGITVLHICKDHVRLPMYADYPADAVNWAIHDCRYGLKDGRNLFPDKAILGGFDDRSGVLVEGSREEIEQEAALIVREAGAKRLIIGADCTLPTEIAHSRIRETVLAVRNLREM